MSGRLNSQLGRPWIFLSGATDPLKGIVVPNAGTFPLQQQLMTDEAVPVAIEATQSTANPKHLILNSSDYLSHKLQVGDWIYIQNTIRQVITIYESKTLIELDYAFPSTVTAEDVFVTQPVANRHLKIEAVGTVDTATVNGVALKAGSFVEFNEPAGIAPIYYSAASASQSLKFIVGQ